MKGFFPQYAIFTVHKLKFVHIHVSLKFINFITIVKEVISTFSEVSLVGTILCERVARETGVSRENQLIWLSETKPNSICPGQDSNSGCLGEKQVF